MRYHLIESAHDVRPPPVAVKDNLSCHRQPVVATLPEINVCTLPAFVVQDVLEVHSCHERPGWVSAE